MSRAITRRPGAPGSLAHALERTASERDGALSLVERLLAFARKQGGYTTAEQQALLREASAVLVEAGFGAQGDEAREAERKRGGK